VSIRTLIAAGQGGKALRKLTAGERLASDDEYGVIAGEGADNVMQRGPVKCAGQEVRRAWWGAKDHQVRRGVSGDQQLG
jgi:hypothetical protein